MRKFSKTEEQILRELAEFQYLTTSQLVRLGVTKSKNSLYPVLRGLVNAQSPAIKKINYNVSPALGRLESIFYLTHVGVKFLLGLGLEADTIKFPKRKDVSFASDYKHRIWTVDFFISLKLWVNEQGYELQYFYYYFEQSSGSNRNNKGGISLADTRIDINAKGIGYIQPDGIFLVDRGDETPIFGLFEQHNGKNTKKLLEQLEAHRIAISTGAPSLKYDVQHNGEYIANRVFIVFENEGCMKATMRRISKEPVFEAFVKHFVSDTIADLLKHGLNFRFQIE